MVFHPSFSGALFALPNRLFCLGGDRAEGVNLLDLVLVFLLDDLAAPAARDRCASAGAHARVPAHGGAGAATGVEAEVEHRPAERGFFPLGEDEPAGGRNDGGWEGGLTKRRGAYKADV